MNGKYYIEIEIHNKMYKFKIIIRIVKYYTLLTVLIKHNSLYVFMTQYHEVL